MPSTRRAYQFQLNVARQRGIPWELTYGTWCAWWEQQLGVNWHQMRGRKAGQYVMARYNDIGPYSVENVKCILHTDNTKEAAPRMRGKRKAKLSKELVLAIRAASGVTRDIAAQYGIV